MNFPIWGLTKERIILQPKKKADTTQSVAALDLSKTNKSDYRWEEKTRLFPKWVLFSQETVSESGLPTQIAIDNPLSKLIGLTYLVLRKSQLKNSLII